MTDERTSRRRLLVTAGTAVATFGLAGCSGGGGGNGNGGGTDDEDDPDPTSDGTALRQPQASFTFDYEADSTLDDSGEPWAGTDTDGVLTISHITGQGVQADRLRLAGDGLTTAGDGRWHEQADPSPSEPDGNVTTGDSTSIEVDSDFELDLVWDPQSVDTSATLAEESGPDA